MALSSYGVKVEINAEYAPEYIELVLDELKRLWGLDEKAFAHGHGHHKPLNNGAMKRSILT